MGREQKPPALLRLPFARQEQRVVIEPQGELLQREVGELQPELLNQVSIAVLQPDQSAVVLIDLDFPCLKIHGFDLLIDLIGEDVVNQPISFRFLCQKPHSLGVDKFFKKRIAINDFAAGELT